MTFVAHPRFAPFEELFDAFAADGFEIVFVGGCVRDLVMEKDEIGDIDLATSAPPSETKRVLKASGFRAIPLGEKFGTITTMVGDVTVEITTYRVGELYEHGSRHPVVRFGTDLKEDLVRRDLSINAMAMHRDGTIVDPFDGQRAIRERTLEVPGGGYEETISILRDDPLRLLRTARFAARFDFPPTDDTTRAARESAAELEHISRERWKVELDKLLVAAHATRGLSWLQETGAFRVVLPELTALDAADVEALGAHVADAPADALTRWAVLAWRALLGREAFDPDAAAVQLSAPYGERAAALADALADRFKWSNKERKVLKRLLASPFSPGVLGETPTTPTLRRWYDAARDDVFRQLDVAAALWPALHEAVSARRAELRALLEREDPVPRLPSGLGNRLRAEVGLTGPAIGEAMALLREEILEGRVDNGADAETYLAHARRVLAKG